MIQPPQIHNELVHEIGEVVQAYAGYFILTGLGLAALYIGSYVLKGYFAEWFAGVNWKRNVEYRRLDSIYIFTWKKIGVIEYISAFDTAITLYTISIGKDGRTAVSGGMSIIVRNAELRAMHIARFKPHLGDVNDIPEFILNDLK